MVPKSSNYTLLTTDAGFIFPFNGSSLTATLPSTLPTMPWVVEIKNLNATQLVIGRNGNTINGVAANLTLEQYQAATCASDTVTATNYVCDKLKITLLDLPTLDFGVGTSKTFSLLTGGLFECSASCGITLPVPAAGIGPYCVRNGNNATGVITFNALGSSSMYENTAGTGYGSAATGTLASSGAVKDQMCLVGKDSTHYDIFSSNGTWVAN